jgi:hypothetical protein
MVREDAKVGIPVGVPEGQEWCCVQDQTAQASEAPHTCHKQEDLYEDFTTLCTCCAYCTQQCADDI